MWLDDRTRSGREPKVSPGLASQKETEEERKQDSLSDRERICLLAI
ncbi:gas vesicle protein GvpC [Klebsiella oxytoca]|nr:gas vesicle protein GvpC [Klebsiella oxytoca]